MQELEFASLFFDIVGFALPIAFPHMPRWAAILILILTVSLGLLWVARRGWKPQLAAAFISRGVTMAHGAKNILKIGNFNKLSNLHVGDVNVNQAPEPRLKLLDQQKETRPDGTCLTTYVLEVVAPFQVPRLTIEARAPHIKHMSIRQDGPTTSKTSVKRWQDGGVCGESFGPVHGRYVLAVVTGSDSAIALSHAFRDVQ